MKYRSVETKPFNDKSLRERIYEGLSVLNPLSYKPVRKALYAAAVVYAVAQGTEEVDKVTIQKALAKGIPTVEESVEATTKYASDLVGMTTPVVEEIKSNVVATLFDFNLPVQTNPTLNYTETSNKTVELKIEDISSNYLTQEINQSEEANQSSGVKTTPLSTSMAFTPAPTPAIFGSEVTEERFRQELHEEEIVSIERPFNYKEANDIFQASGLTVEDLINSKMKSSKELSDFSSPNIPAMAMFNDETMRWAPLINSLNKKYNGTEEFGNQFVGDTEFLSLIFVESYGKDCINPNSAGARSPAQVTDYALSFAPGKNIFEKRNFASIPANGVEIGYKWYLMKKKENNPFFQEKGITDPVTKNAINFMTYNGGRFYSFEIAEGNEAHARNFVDTYQMQQYGSMLSNFSNNYQLLVEAYNRGQRVTYADSLNPDNDLHMFQSDFIDQILIEAKKRKLSSGTYDYQETRKILDQVIDEFAKERVALQTIKKENTEGKKGTLEDVTLSPAARAVLLFER